MDSADLSSALRYILGNVPGAHAALRQHLQNCTLRKQAKELQKSAAASGVAIRSAQHLDPREAGSCNPVWIRAAQRDARCRSTDHGMWFNEALKDAAGEQVKWVRAAQKQLADCNWKGAVGIAVSLSGQHFGLHGGDGGPGDCKPEAVEMLTGVFELWHEIKQHLESSEAVQCEKGSDLNGAVLAQLQAAVRTFRSYLGKPWSWQLLLQQALHTARQQQQHQQKQQQQQQQQEQQARTPEQKRAARQQQEEQEQLQELTDVLRACVTRRALLAQLFSLAPSEAALAKYVPAAPATEQAALKRSCATVLFDSQPSLQHMDILIAAVGAQDGPSECKRCLAVLMATFNSMSIDNQRQLLERVLAEKQFDLVVSAMESLLKAFESETCDAYGCDGACSPTEEFLLSAVRLLLEHIAQDSKAWDKGLLVHAAKVLVDAAWMCLEPEGEDVDEGVDGTHVTAWTQLLQEHSVRLLRQCGLKPAALKGLSSALAKLQQCAAQAEGGADTAKDQDQAVPTKRRRLKK